MAQKRTLVSKSLDNTAQIAKEFVENLWKSDENCGKLATIVALEGDLGAGKTTFVKAVAQALGIQKTVTSPTFVLEKVYKFPARLNLTGNLARFRLDSGFTHLIHIDAYRLENGAELLSLGWREMASDPHNIIFIEWPERVAEVLPEKTRMIRFKFIDETTRVLTIVK